MGKGETLPGEVIYLLASKNFKHRGHLDLIADILKESKSGARKTFLMYHCNLSFKQLKYYLSFLQAQGLIKANAEDINSNSIVFETTDKGEKFLRAYHGLKTLIRA